MLNFLPCMLAFAWFAADEVELIKLAAADVGKLPEAWTSSQTGLGEGSVWRLVTDETAGGTGLVLRQEAAGPSAFFNLCVYNDASFKNGRLSVRFKAKTGVIDQGGGVLWRYVDANNYYVCRFNPLERNLRVYTVKDGRRKQLATQEDLDFPAGEWHTLFIDHEGDRIECGIGGKTYLKVRDDTFKDAGKVGLWTKADAVTSFSSLLMQAR